MLITKFSFDNLYGFEKFEVDLTYPTKLSFSSIEHEYLEFAPKFKVKRLCLISGGNATGKTSIGRLLCAATNIICGQIGAVAEYVKIRDTTKEATIQLEFVTPHNQRLNNITFTFKQGEKGVELIKTDAQTAKIRKSDTQTATRQRWSEVTTHSLAENPEIDLAKNMVRQVFSDEYAPVWTGWNYVFYENIENSMNHFVGSNQIDITKATKILKAFDPSIVSIELMRADNQNAYQIRFENGDLLVVDMGAEKSELNDPRRLSKGTFEGLSIIRFIDDMSRKNLASTTYFLDERMAHVHTELEKSMLNVMIQKLGTNSQFFYTSHNTDILELDVPVHSHLFLKRNENGLVEAIQPERTFKKNDRKLANYVKNDVFGTCPDASLIDELAYED